MSAAVLRFRGFQLDAATRELTRAGETVPLPPKVFDCIVYLAQHRDRAIGRDELIAAVWGKADVSDGVLGQTILLARRALEDTGKEQQVIRTVLRFGYHWVAAIEETSAEAPATASPPPVESTAPPTQPRRPGPRVRQWQRASLLAVAVLLAALLVVAGLLHAGRRAPADRGGAATAMLVLPVEVVGDDAAAWIRLGVMDLIAARLRASGRPVVPSDNVVALVRAYRAAASDAGELSQLAAAANAGVVVAATAEHHPGGWRVHLRSLAGRAPAVQASAEADDVLDAARAAADRLATALGHPTASPPPEAATTLAGDELVQRVEAALLEDRTGDAIRILEQAPPAERASPALRFQRGRADFMAGRFEEAATAFGEVIGGVPPEVDPILRARALNGLAGIAIQHGRPREALPLLDRALVLLDGSNALSALGSVYNNRAASHAQLRDFAAARADLAQARIAVASAGDMLGLAIIDSNAGAAAQNRDLLAEAEPILAGAAERFATFRAWSAELNARNNLALVRLDMLDPAAALALEPRLRELARLVPDPERRRATALVRVRILDANGRLREADDLLASLRQEADAAGDAEVAARAAALSAWRRLAAGDAGGAEREALAALAAQPRLQDARETGRTWLALVRARLATGNVEGAATAIGGARAWALADGSPVAQLHVGLATVAAGHVAPPSPRDALEELLHRAEAGRVPVDILEAAKAYAGWLMATGDYERASVAAEAVAAWSGRDYGAALLQLRVFHALRSPRPWENALQRVRDLAGERPVPPELAGRP
ncbi:MAG: transcriptional regulator [Xanthomonadales bacterium]|nr:transcriptional regulator [Xanthomonadales bacterium]